MEFDLPKGDASIIKVIGVGGGGSNAVNHMYELGIKGVDFVVCNTDRQALDISPVPFKIQLGPSLTEGRGAGAIPEIGRNAAVENIDEIREYLSKGTKMVFVTAGMGGGTGTGAAPVIAQIAKEMNILTVGIVTVPFAFEGRRRRQQAEEGMEEMRQNVDTLLVINNERLRELGGNMSLSQSFAMADNVLSTAAKGIAEVITTTGSINVDFNDVNTVMRNSGHAIMGSAMAEGEDRAVAAVKEALNSPLLNDNNIEGATYILLNITYGDSEVTMDEIGEITDFIQNEAGSTADVIWGHGYDASLGNKLSITLVATGYKSAPITGFEKAAQRVVRPLEEEPKNEIITPLTSPTQTIATVISEEPFLKVQEEVIKAKKDKKNEPVAEVKSQTVIELKTEEPTETNDVVEFGWEMSTEVSKMETPTSAPVVSVKEEKTVFVLNDEVENTMSLESVNQGQRSPISPEELQRRNVERITRLETINNKLKKADGIRELEEEPAFVRRNIKLDTLQRSDESRVSRFGLSDDNGGLKTNNSFLHDNVD